MGNLRVTQLVSRVLALTKKLQPFYKFLVTVLVVLGALWIVSMIFVSITGDLQRRGLDWLTLGGMILGLIWFVVKWAWSLPGYVWLALIMIELLLNIRWLLSTLNTNVISLTQAVRSFKTAVKDNDDGWDNGEE